MLTTLSIFYSSGWKTDVGLHVNLELACEKIALNMSENIMAVIASLVSSNSGLHPVFWGSLLILRYLNFSLYSGPNMHKQKSLF